MEKHKKNFVLLASIGNLSCFVQLFPLFMFDLISSCSSHHYKRAFGSGVNYSNLILNSLAYNYSRAVKTHSSLWRSYSDEREDVKIDGLFFPLCLKVRRKLTSCSWANRHFFSNKKEKEVFDYLTSTQIQ